MFTLLLAYVAAGCRKNDSTPRIDFGPNGGITETDANNRQIGNVDLSDWTHDATWNTQEMGLFDELGLALNDTPGSGFDLRTLRTLYPNPVGVAQAQLTFIKPQGMSGEFVVVSQQYQIIDRFSLSAANATYGISMQFPTDKYVTGQTYRLYYVFYTGPTLQAKGHGDFRTGR